MSRVSWLVWVPVIVAACGGRGVEDPSEIAGDTSDPVVERYEAELFPTTKVLGPSEVDELLSIDEDGRLHLSGDSPLGAGLRSTT